MKRADIIKNTVKETFGKYTENKDLRECDIIHLYDTGKLGQLGNGHSRAFIDSRIFKAVFYNTATKEYRESERHDNDQITSCEGNIRAVRIFVDGSTMVMLKNKASLDQFISQSIDV